MSKIDRVIFLEKEFGDSMDELVEFTNLNCDHFNGLLLDEIPCVCHYLLYNCSVVVVSPGSWVDDDHSQVWICELGTKFKWCAIYLPSSGDVWKSFGMLRTVVSDTKNICNDISFIFD